MEVACGYLADVLAQKAIEEPVFKSRDLEEATRQLARAAHRAELSESAVVTWLGVASAIAFGGGRASVGLTRQLHAWAADEYAAAAIASGRPCVGQVA
jgi:hypothetical protein